MNFVVTLNYQLHSVAIVGRLCVTNSCVKMRHSISSFSHFLWSFTPLSSSISPFLIIDDLAGSPQGEYGQDMPPRRAEKVSGPPFIPPHLLQVILNKDTPAHCEPTLLPEPNHVMLNHLYALSIKDGVMVLSATHRFRKKYVTTLLYKPI